MDIDKVRELTDAELTDELAKQRRHLYDLRFQLATRQLTDHNQLSQGRRTIARILTVITEREAERGGRPAASTTGRTPARETGRPAAASGGRRRAAATAARGGNDER